MRRSSHPDAHRYDRTLRVVMWADAFLSVTIVAVGVVASPVVALLGVPPAIRFPIAVVTIVCAVLLAAFGAITAVVLMLRMHRGQYQLPARLWLPLPPGLRPPMYAHPRRSGA